MLYPICGQGSLVGPAMPHAPHILLYLALQWMRGEREASKGVRVDSVTNIALLQPHPTPQTSSTPLHTSSTPPHLLNPTPPTISLGVMP